MKAAPRRPDDSTAQPTRTSQGSADALCDPRPSTGRSRPRSHWVLALLLALLGCGERPTVYLDVPADTLDGGSGAGAAGGDGHDDGDHDDGDDDDDNAQTGDHVDDDDEAQGATGSDDVQQGNGDDADAESVPDAPADDGEASEDGSVSCQSDLECGELGADEDDRLGVGEGHGRCSPVTGRCVECLSDTDCEDDDKSICEAAAGRCVGCLGDADCLPGLTCDVAEGECKGP